MAHTFFRVKLMPVSIAYVSDSMKSIQKIIIIKQVLVLADFQIDKHAVIRLIIPFRMLYDHTKCVFHDNHGVVNCVPEFSALQLLICFVEMVSQLFNVIRIVLAAMARSVKSGCVVSVPPVTLPVITFTVVTIKLEAVTTVTFCVPAEAIEAVHIKAVTVEPPFVSTGVVIPLGAVPVFVIFGTGIDQGSDSDCQSRDTCSASQDACDCSYIYFDYLFILTFVYCVVSVS